MRSFNEKKYFALFLVLQVILLVKGVSDMCDNNIIGDYLYFGIVGVDIGIAILAKKHIDSLKKGK